MHNVLNKSLSLPLELRELHSSNMIVKPSIAFNDFAGTAKDVTARNVHGRNILSSRAQHSKIVTPAQAVSRNRLSRISRTFRQLSDSQINQWEVLAGHMKGISTFGQAAVLTAHNAFVRINTNRTMVGMPPLTDAPVYMNDVPEVLYDDLWISPDVIVFTGLVVPSDSYRLVVKMSPAQSPGTTSCWSKTVIVAPGIVPDWGDADVTKLFTDTIGVAPEAGMKYYLECWWLDAETGFTGESMWVSAICKSGSTAYNTEYIPRQQIKEGKVDSIYDYGYVEDMDFELVPGSVIISNNMKVHYTSNLAGVELHITNYPDDIKTGIRCFHAARSLADNRRIILIENYIRDEKRRGYVSVGSSTRGGAFGEDNYEVFSTAVAAN